MFLGYPLSRTPTRRPVRPATLEWLEAQWRSGKVSPETWLRHEGGSMVPALRRGDRLLVTPLRGAPSPRAGEIVLVRRGNRLVAHRLVAMKRGIAITRGDALPRPDPPLAFGDLLGRVVRVERSRNPARRLRSWLSHFTRNRRQR